MDALAKIDTDTLWLKVDKTKNRRRVQPKPGGQNMGEMSEPVKVTDLDPGPYAAADFWGDLCFVICNISTTSSHYVGWHNIMFFYFVPFAKGFCSQPAACLTKGRLLGHNTVNEK